MQITSDTADWVNLSLVTELGPRGFSRLLAAIGPPKDILSAHHADLASHVGDDMARRILTQDRQKPVERTLEWLSQNDHGLLTLADQNYPGSLLQIGSPPPLLFFLGNPDHLRRPGLAIVGSRNASPQGLANARAFAKAVSIGGLTVISGLALGIDTAAHRGALEGSGSTIAVLGCGIDRCYPKTNAALADEIAKRGVIVSEFALNTPPLAGNFPRRNRIISGLAKGCLVVEAALASGSLITAKLAAEQGREVFAIPGSIHSPHARGCHSLIRDGAKLVEDVQDILTEFNLTPGKRKHKRFAPEHALLQYIGYDPCHLDDIVDRSRMSAGAVSAALLSLELEGQVGCLSGGWYQRIG
jgi:DNA processing protein